MNRNRARVGLAANVLAFVTSLIVNVMLAPFLVSRLGEEAFGFVALINGFANVAAVISTSLNLMAGRYIALALHAGDVAGARRYLSSTIATNLALAAGYITMLIPVLIHVDLIVNVSPRLRSDVQAALGLVVVTFIVTSVLNVLAAGAIVQNRVDLLGWRDIAGHLSRIAAVVALFIFFPPHVYFIVVGSLVSAIIIGILNVKLARLLLPRGLLKLRSVRLRAGLSLLAAGGLYMLNGVSGFLMNDATLLLVNRGLGAHSMGMLAIARLVPYNILALAAVVSATFTPRLIQLFGGRETGSIVGTVRESVITVASLVSVPFAGYLAFGHSFLVLWLPSLSPKDVNLIFGLSVVLTLGCVADAFTAPLFPLFVAVGRMRLPTAASLAIGLVSVGGVLWVMAFRDWDLLGVVVVVSLMTVIRVFLVLPLIASALLKVSVGLMLRPILRASLVFAVILGLFSVVQRIVVTSSWSMLLLVAFLTGSVGWCIAFVFLGGKLPIVHRESKS